jgi:O-antigen ligase
MAVFSCSLVLGMAWGLANGGDARIAIFEVAPLLYVPLVYFAACNLYPSVRSYQWLMAGIVDGLTAEVINGLVRLPTIRQLIAADQSPLEHTALLHLNLLPLLLLACLWFGTDRIGLRLLLSVLLVPAMLLYLDAQRRAAVVALIVGTIALSAVLFVRNRTRFNVFVPVLVVLLTGYVGAFWSSDNQIGFPAQAIRSVIAPSSASEADSLSDLYRYIENFDLNATIRSNPLLGLGFGRPFLQPIELPDIVSFFEFADYQPHNTILWIWIKTGLVGFIAFMYMIGVALAQGMRAAVRVVASDEASVVAVLSSYLPMAVVVAFVEISGEAATTMLLGLALAMASTVGERLEPV